MARRNDDYDWLDDPFDEKKAAEERERAAVSELFNAFSMGSSFSRQQNHKVSGTDPAPERQEARTAWVNRLVIPPQEPRRTVFWASTSTSVSLYSPSWKVTVQ